MEIIIRLSEAARKAALAADKEKPYAERLNPHENGDYVQRLSAETPQQHSVCEALSLSEYSTFRLGNFVQSRLTRQPYVQPVVYDTPPAGKEIWQQLEAMAQQLPQAINDTITVF